MYEVPLSNSSSLYDMSNSNNYCSDEGNEAHVSSYFNQSIDHYYNLENRPRQMPFHCENCSKDFYNQHQYKKHIDAHVKCPFPECKVEGSEKYIDTHISYHIMVNFELLLVDKETWQGERKKKFPSLERVNQRRELQVEMLKKERLRKEAKLKKEQKRLAEKEQRKTQRVNEEEEEKADWNVKRYARFPCEQRQDLKRAKEIERSKRGERLEKESKRFPKRNITGKNSSFKRKYRKNYKDCEESQDFNSNISKDFDDCSDAEERYGIPAFKGTKAFYESLGEISLFGVKSDFISKEKQEELEISDDEDLDNFNEPTMEIDEQQQQCVLHNALGSLMGAYGSDSDIDENENSTKEQMSKSSNDINVTNSIKITEAAPNRSLSEDGKLKEKSYKRKRKHMKGSSKDGNKSNLRLKGNNTSSTKKFSDRYRRRILLEKLLEPQIIHERNIILQSVRYIVDNNFFDSGKKSP